MERTLHTIVISFVRRMTAICVIVFAASIISAAEPDATDTSLAEQLPRIPAKEPAEATKTFEVQHRFSMRLVAHEPNVVDPVDAAFDEDGRLWVAEMRGYPYPESDAKPIGRIRVLTDADRDGQFESSTIFAEDLYWPTGIAIWNGGCYVIAAPDILYLKDTDGDGRADQRTVAFTGFERKNVQALANNLKWGIDNRFHGATAANGGSIRPGSEPDREPISVRGRDFLLDPRTGTFSQDSGTAQFGHSFNDWYDRFVCSNSDHAIQVVLPIRYLDRNPQIQYPSVLRSIAKEGGAAPVFRRSSAEPWRLVRTARRAASGDKFAPTELFAIGFFTSASGITVYRGDAYPEEHHGELFVGDVGGNLIHRKRLIDNGNAFLAQRADDGVEFVTSSDNWFRPVNFLNGPDGCLYVLDMYRETIEHPWSIPEDIKAHLDLESGRDRGRIYRLEPPDFQRRAVPQLSQATTEELVSLLSHQNAWHRETAQRLLIERADATAIAMLRDAVASSKSDLQLVHLLWTLQGLDGLQESDIRVGLQSQSARLREHAIRLAEPLLRESTSLGDAVVGLANDAAARVRMQLAFSVGKLPAAEKAPVLASLASADDDPLLRAAVLSSAFDCAVEMLASCLNGGDSNAAFVRELSRIVASQQNGSALSRLPAILENQPTQNRLAVLAGLVDGINAPPDKLASVLVEKGGQCGAWSRAAGQEYQAIAADTEQSVRHRLDALRATRIDPSRCEQVSEQILTNEQEPGDLRLTALRELAAINAPSQARILRESWSSATPVLRSEILEAMLSRPALQTALVEAIEQNQIPAAQLSPSVRQRLAQSNNATVKQRAAELFSTQTSARRDVVAKYIAAIADKPDPLAGRKVFDRECASCHKLANVGHDVGPNLATIQSRSPEQLIANILDPNVEVLPNYVEYTVLLLDGRVATGMVVSESAGTIVLKRAEGIEQPISRDEIDAIQNSGRSLMPEGLEQKISPREMSDLIAFLRDPASAELGKSSP